MEVKIFKISNAVTACGNNKVMEMAFRDFFDRIELCDWEKPNDILKSFRTADIVSCIGKSYNRVVFNIGGNKYRMICGYKFTQHCVMLYIRFVGTHAEYDLVDVCTIKQF